MESATKMLSVHAKSVVRDTSMIGPARERFEGELDCPICRSKTAERGFAPLHEAERPRQSDEHPLHGLEWPDLDDPRTATLCGTIAACLGLIVLAFAWWPL